MNCSCSFSHVVKHENEDDVMCHLSSTGSVQISPTFCIPYIGWQDFKASCLSDSRSHRGYIARRFHIALSACLRRIWRPPIAPRAESKWSPLHLPRTSASQKRWWISGGCRAVGSLHYSACASWRTSHIMDRLSTWSPNPGSNCTFSDNWGGSRSPRPSWKYFFSSASKSNSHWVHLDLVWQ